MIDLLIYVLILVIIFALFYYVINNLLPEPLRKMANVILVVLGGIALIYLLLQFTGGHAPRSLLRP